MLRRVILQAKTPLSFRAGRSTSRSSTLTYVPGSASLGGLAGAYCSLRESMQTDDVSREHFADWFLGENLYCGNLYPAMFDSDALRNHEMPVHPIPSTARSCKRFPGFRFGAHEADDARHGVTDALIPLTLFALTGEGRPGVLGHLQNCPICSEPLDSFSGFYRRGAKADEVGRSEVRLALRTRSGIAFSTGTAQQGVLYSREVLQEGSTFWGLWRIPDAGGKSFESFVEEAVNAGRVRLGNNRTRGLGCVSIEMREQAGEDCDTLRQRVQAFDVALRQAATEAGIETPAALYVPLTLTSDAILYDRLLRPQLQVTSGYLSEKWALTGATVISQVSAVHRLQGWSALWGLPKPDELAIAMGSVFVVALTSINAETWSRLHALQEHGLGSRRTEGFGALRVADSFHFECRRTEGVYR